MGAEMIIEWLNKIFGDGAAGAAVAGALGGLVRWITLREHWVDGMIAVFIGGIAAVYLSPLVFPLVGPILSVVIDEPEPRERLSSFLTGLAGIAIIGFLIDTLQALKHLKKIKKEEEDK
jgi:MFS family permease